MHSIRHFHLVGFFALQVVLATTLQLPVGGGPGTVQDPGALPIGEKELILQNGPPDQAAKVWETLKGRTVQIPDALVIETSPRVLKVAVSNEAVRSKTADFTFQLKSIRVPAVGSKVTFAGTYDSFTQNPIMIVMRDAVVVLPTAEPHGAQHSLSSGK
jgi:hypothetical protein